MKDVIKIGNCTLKRRKDGRFKKMVNGTPVYAINASEMLRKLSDLKYKIENGEIFGNVAEDWKEEHFSTVAYTTAKSYDTVFKCVMEEFQNRYINQITAQDIQGYINRVAKKGYSQRTVKNNLMIITMIFDYAVLNGFLSVNTAQPVKLPKGLPKNERTTPSDSDINIVKSSLNVPFGLFAFFLLYTGCRRGEALAAKYEDVDRKNKTILINKSLYFEHNRPKIKTPKSRAGERTIIVPDILLDKLPKGKGYIFSVDENPLSEQQYRLKWKSYVKKTGINLTPHQLRHQYATFLYDAGIDDKSAQSLLGHSSIVVTKDIYTHISKQKENKTQIKLNDFFNEVQTIEKPHD